MIVVSDTTPIISLLKINRLDLLKKLYGSVLIPLDFIECYVVHNTQALTILQAVTTLDLGESEAIILAQEHKADVLLMDESKGRKVAQQLNIP